MTVRQALKQARAMLAARKTENPPLESEVLLRHALEIDRVQLYLELDRQLSPAQSEHFWQLIKRRLNDEPTAYIVGYREFNGLDFYVNSSVLIPRPETELLVEKALELARYQSPSSIADIGTGCGAIAVCLALELPRSRIYATDISAAALKVASSNCRKHGVADRVKLLEGDMLDPLPEPVDLLVANLPYVSEWELSEVNTLGFEPSLALSGGSDGLEKIRRLCAGINGRLRPKGHLLMEIGQGQAKVITDLLYRLFPSPKIKLAPDLAGIGRVLIVDFIS